MNHRYLLLLLSVSLGFACILAKGQPFELPKPEHKTIALPNYDVEAKPAPTYTQVPNPPATNAKGFILIDAKSGRILAEQHADQHLAPASLTKLMTLFLISDAIQKRRIHLSDPVTISEKAWRMGGSKMFVEVGKQVAVEDLLRGAIIASGNDATIALAEFLAGSEENFVTLMNQQAKQLGMNDTHFVDSTGLPHPNHYTTPHDIALLSRALILYFPEEYRWYQQKWFKWGKIRQPNRNRLLWRDEAVDGIKTGHTDDAGYCLAASAKKGPMRLIAIVMGSRSDRARFDQAQRLLHFGFRYYETHRVFAARQQIVRQRTWQGRDKMTSYGVKNDLFITVPVGNFHRVSASMRVSSMRFAPVKKDDPNGELFIRYDNDIVAKAPLIALNDDPRGGIWRQLVDFIRISWFGLLGDSADLSQPLLDRQ